MKTEFDKEVLNRLYRELEIGLVKVHFDADKYFKEIESQFEMVYNGINWSGKNIVYSIDIFDSISKRETINKFMIKICQNHPEIFNENVIVIGDGAINLGYEMNFKLFISKSHVFFDLPQHTYVWFLRIKKCINYTFRNELFYG